MENKTGNYFKYAIGEIVLVVIGILIALFINNKNKESSHETKITNILIEMQSDIITNIENSYMIFDYQIYTDSISKLILNNIFTAADYRLGTAETIGYNYRDFRMITNGFDNLKTNFNHIPKKYKHLLPTIKEMYSINKITIDDYNNRLRKIVYKNTDSMDKFDWILDRNNDITSEAEIEYRLNDSDYKKMVVSYMSSRANLFYLI